MSTVFSYVNFCLLYTIVFNVYIFSFIQNVFHMQFSGMLWDKKPKADRVEASSALLLSKVAVVYFSICIINNIMRMCASINICILI